MPKPRDSRLISSPQLAKLQTLWSQHAQRSLDVIDDPRTARLNWASSVLHRAIPSFKELTAAEAAQLIDELGAALGYANRDRAWHQGTDGRRNISRTRVSTMASVSDLSRIQDAVRRLGWTQEQFETWLGSRTSPIGGRKEIRTLADANRVWWALKRMLVTQVTELATSTHVQEVSCAG